MLQTGSRQNSRPGLWLYGMGSGSFSGGRVLIEGREVDLILYKLAVSLEIFEVTS